VGSRKSIGDKPKKIECPRCHEHFKPAGFAGHQQHSKCWLDARKAPSDTQPEGSLDPAPFAIPPHDSHFWVSEQTQKALKAAFKRSQKAPVVIQVKGPKGCGKTSLAQYFAAFYQRPFWGEACNLKEDAVELLSRREYLQGKGTITLPTTLTKALQTPGCVVLLDEVNRFLDPRAPNALFNLLDHRHEAPVEGLGQVVVAPGVVLFLTLNEGAGYFGTIPVDDALNDRVQLFIPLDYPPTDVVVRILNDKAHLNLRDSETLARVWFQINNSPKHKDAVSMRRLLSTAKLITKGKLSLKVALAHGIGYAIGDPELVLQALQQVQPTEGTPSAAEANEYLSSYLSRLEEEILS
jgi:nitric oxide reductase NorQ protein